jgi:hypothetical protein
MHGLPILPRMSARYAWSGSSPRWAQFENRGSGTATPRSLGRRRGSGSPEAGQAASGFERGKTAPGGELVCLLIVD